MADLFIPDPFSALPEPRVTPQNDPGLPVLSAAIRGVSSASRAIADAEQEKTATVNALNGFADIIEADDPAKANALRNMANETELIIPFAAGAPGGRGGVARSLKSAAGGITTEMLRTIGDLVAEKQQANNALAEIQSRGTEQRKTRAFGGMVDRSNTVFDTDLKAEEKLKDDILSLAGNGQIKKNDADGLLSLLAQGAITVDQVRRDVINASTSTQEAAENLIKRHGGGRPVSSISAGGANVSFPTPRDDTPTVAVEQQQAFNPETGEPLVDAKGNPVFGTTVTSRGPVGSVSVPSIRNNPNPAAAVAPDNPRATSRRSVLIDGTRASDRGRELNRR